MIYYLWKKDTEIWANKFKVWLLAWVVAPESDKAKIPIALPDSGARLKPDIFTFWPDLSGLTLYRIQGTRPKDFFAQFLLIVSNRLGNLLYGATAMKAV